MTVIRRLIVSTCLLFLASGVWFGLVAARPSVERERTRADQLAARPVHRLLASVSSQLAVERFRNDTLYAQARQADRMTAAAITRQMIAEGRLSQEKAACGSW